MTAPLPPIPHHIPVRMLLNSSHPQKFDAYHPKKGLEKLGNMDNENAHHPPQPPNR